LERIVYADIYTKPFLISYIILDNYLSKEDLIENFVNALKYQFLLSFGGIERIT